MVNFSVEQVRQMMDLKANIRNMSVIAHVDHGKTTLSDSLVCKAGIISAERAGTTCYMSKRKDERDRGITIKSAAISLFYELAEDSATLQHLPAGTQGRRFLINMIDSPGHVDFSSEVTAALRVTDGALVIVDCVEGVCVQTETVLRQALAERVKPVLVLNKVDRMLLELQLEPEEMYQGFLRSIESVNVVVATHNDDALSDVQVRPEAGSVAFASGKQQWAFTLDAFARMYASKFGVDSARMMERLWGDNFYDPQAHRWGTSSRGEDGSELPRAFCQFVLAPIVKLSRAVMNGDTATVDRILETIGVVLRSDERALSQKDTLRTIMSRWLPAADCLLQMMVVHLPSPAVAQRYRCEVLYTGPQDDLVAQAIRDCNPDGPLLVYVSKMVPTSDRGRFHAFGRVFSGTVRSGASVHILAGSHEPGVREDVSVHNVQRTVIPMGREEAVEDCPCGNVLYLGGIDQYMVKSGTLADSARTWPIKEMKFSVSPVVRVAVEPRKAADLPKLVEGLKSLSKSDPLCLCTIEESGQHIVAGAGELHLEICLKDLREFCGAELVVSEPVVSFREGVTAPSSQLCLSKTSNKLNRLFMSAEPFTEGLAEAIEDHRIDIHQDQKTLARALVEKYSWDIGAARGVWCFGPDVNGPNTLVDVTKGIQNLAQSKDHLVAAFQWATKDGPLCGEPVRGVCFNLRDALLHRDPMHRGGGQLIPAAKRCLGACMLTAQPRLLEPVFLVDIQCPESAIGGVYDVLNRRRGAIVSEETRQGGHLCVVQAHLPVLESFGFSEDLRARTGGHAFPQSRFDHWQCVPGDPLEAGSKAATIVAQVRHRKGLKDGVPSLDSLVDKL